jgi:hypothetical protein
VGDRADGDLPDAVWHYIGGRIGSPENADTRRADLRANPLAPDVWIMAIFTGLVGFAALLALVAVMARLVTLPESAPIVAPTGVPRLTVFLLLVMSSIVAGVTEEGGFRGYGLLRRLYRTDKSESKSVHATAELPGRRRQFWQTEVWFETLLWGRLTLTR